MGVRFDCKDCGVDTRSIHEYYMVAHEVWRQAEGGSGMLCIGCLEDRIGRKLTATDFLHAPANLPLGNAVVPKDPAMGPRLSGYRQSARLADRLEGWGFDIERYMDEIDRVSQEA